MRTNIEIDDDLMQQAMQGTGASTKRAAVEAGLKLLVLKLLVQLQAQTAIRNLWGTVEWEGDRSRVLPPVS